MVLYLLQTYPQGVITDMSMTVRPANQGDKQKCLEFISALRQEIIQDNWTETYDSLIKGDRGTILVASDDKFGVLGMATISFNLAIRYGGEYCQLEEFFVDPAARGKNAGGMLIEAILNTARTRGCVEIGLYLIERTSHNRLFYEKYGFKVVGDEMRQPLG